MATSHSINVHQAIQNSSKASKGEAHHMNAINNNVLRMSPRRQAALFADWFKNLIDNDRSSLSLYLSDETVMQWFGRTIKTKKNVAGFIKYDMHFTNHRFSSVEACGPISVRGEKEKPIKIICHDDDEELATPLEGVTPPPRNFSLRTITPLKGLSTKRRRAFSSSPESPSQGYIKKSRTTLNPGEVEDDYQKPMKKSPRQNNDVKKVGNKSRKADGGVAMLEEGQGDCLPSTSGTKKKTLRTSEQNIDYVTQLPRYYVEIRCVIDFTKTGSKRGAEITKWERQCKLQIAYTEDPVHPGEYIIWTIVYGDNNKCRRNLLAAFEAVSLEHENNQSSL